MSYSIFSNTMADMVWTDIEKSIKAGAVVLLPTGVMEQQGPHIGTGYDIYTSHKISCLMKEHLSKQGIETLIAPPFYWGVNHTTGGFTGSFTSRKETVQAVLFDIFHSLHCWGVKNIFIVDVHGDHNHGIALYNGIKEAREKLDLNIRSLISHWVANGLQLNDQHEEFLIFNVELSRPPMVEEVIDIHSGARGTALATKHFNHIVDLETAKILEPTRFTEKEMKTWHGGGEKVREVTPLGYVGAPADYIKAFEEDDFIELFSHHASERIIEFFKRSRFRGSYL